IGRSWAAVFLRAGCPTALFDSDSRQLERANDWIRSQGVAGADRLVLSDSLAHAVEGVDYVQECSPEQLDLKQDVFLQLDRTAPPHAILASSTSAFDMTE